ncbi:MAG: EAL domain-containing protein [Litoreibacter sp.]|nr:EAL domain-containing protein [Litoreibacter sp.]
MSGTNIVASVVKSDADNEDVVQSALNFVRSHLGMEVAYLSEFVDDKLVFRAVDAPGFEEMAAPGISIPLNQVYCNYILSGDLPEVIPDTHDIPLAKSVPITEAVGVRSHVSVPIMRSNGTPYGMFCCLSREPKPDLNPRDLGVMRAFAKISAEQVNEKLSKRTRLEMLREELERVISQERYAVMLQPIMDIRTREPVGFEALTRFRSEPYRPPNLWFDEAADVGMQVDLELAVIKSALRSVSELPEPIYVSLNASPATVASGLLTETLRHQPLDRIVLEVTEHAEIDDPQAVLDQLTKLRSNGLRLAVDDAGAGYSGLQQIVQLKPDIIKLDISLTSGIERDVVRSCLAEALVGFAEQTNAKIVAEGIETEGELDALRRLGVPLGQGYLLGRPADLETSQAWFSPPPRKHA